MQVLDHGYVELVESWGSDERIIEAARMSTGKGFQGWGTAEGEFCEDCDHGIRGGKPCQSCKGTGKVVGDEKLLAYLYNNKHSTPFEMAGMVIEVKAPIFVFREWHRHRTQSYNEMSARYIPLPDENYMPSVERLMAQGGANKQARGATDRVPSESEVKKWLRDLDIVYNQAELIYKYGIQMGIPKELARLPVPVARYSKMRASANLRNWLAFLTLRTATGAQWEIRQYAAAVSQLVANKFPRTWNLFIKDQA